MSAWDVFAVIGIGWVTLAACIITFAAIDNARLAHRRRRNARTIRRWVGVTAVDPAAKKTACLGCHKIRSGSDA